MGTGHVMRCLTLAGGLRARGAECHFICREQLGDLCAEIERQDFLVHRLRPAANAEQASSGYAAWLGATQAEDVRDSLPILTRVNAQWLIVDHYAIDHGWHRIAKKMMSGLRILVIDDLANRTHCCDLLLDQNLGRQPLDYAHLVPDACETLLGSRFALIRSEFTEKRAESLRRRQHERPHRVLISMGGTDPGNVTGALLEALKELKSDQPLAFDVILGAHSPWQAEVRASVESMPWPTTLSIGVSDMANWMMRADLAIGAAGGTSWERCCMGLPVVLLILADNQSRGALALEAAGCAALLENNDDLFRTLPLLIKQLLSGSKLASMSLSASSVCDGQGVKTVIARMEALNGAR